MADESYNFDDGTFQGWTDTSGASTTIAVTVAAALNSSTEGLQLDWAADVTSATNVSRSLALAYSDIYVRCRLYIPTGASMAFAPKFSNFMRLGQSSQFNVRGAVELLYTGTVWNITTDIGTTEHTLFFDVEHEIEARFVKHATTGGFQIWVDDVLVIDELTGDTSTSDVQYLEMGVSPSGGAVETGSTFYIDEIEIAAARIGGVVVASITSVGGDDIVLDAETPAFVTSGFSSEISTVQLVSGTSITNATGVTSISGTGDFDLPDITGYVVDTVGCPLTTANNIVVARLTDA